MSLQLNRDLGLARKMAARAAALRKIRKPEKLAIAVGTVELD